MLQIADCFNIGKMLTDCQRSYYDQLNSQIEKKMISFSNIFLNKLALNRGDTEYALEFCRYWQVLLMDNTEFKVSSDGIVTINDFEN